MKSLLLALAFVSIGASADSVRLLGSAYLSSCDGSVQLLSANTSYVQIQVNANQCKNVDIQSGNYVVQPMKLVDGVYMNSAKYEGVITLDQNSINSLYSVGQLTIFVSSNSQAHWDKVTLVLDRTPIYRSSTYLPNGWSYQLSSGFLFDTCSLYDHTGAWVVDMVNTDNCYYGSNQLPLSWITNWTGNACRVVDQYGTAVGNAVKKENCM